MTDKINDGGAAFPVQFNSDDIEYHNAIKGMSLRDYFAAQALIGELSNSCKEPWKSSEQEKRACAYRCYLFADAMLQARVNVKNDIPA